MHPRESMSFKKTLTFVALAAASLLATPVGTSGQQANVTGVLHLSVGDVETALLPNLLHQRPIMFTPGGKYVIQLDGPISPQRREALEARGVRLGQYVPAFGYLAALDDSEPDALAALPFLLWVGVYEADWKIEPGIGARPLVTARRQEIAAAGNVVLEIAVFETETVKPVLAAIGAMNDVVVHRTYMLAGNPMITVTMPLADVGQLTLIDAVQYVEEASEITLRNSSNRWIVQSNITNITPLYDNGIHGEGQIVGVLDGRPDQQHCSLDGGKILFYNASDGNDTHGTHVSCTAVGDNGADDNTRGVAYGGNMVFNTIPSFTEAAIEARLNTHHSQGARIHTNSWGDDGTTSYNSLARGFDDFLHQNEDDLVCLAVTNLGSLRNPENAKNLLAVGASQDTPSQASHCSGGAGPTADGRRKPEIYAPGCGTTSATPSACSTTNLTGTSMASPAVAGTAALVRQYYVDGYYPTGSPNAPDSFTPSGALVKATLLNSCVDMTGVSGYPSNTEGWGRVLADNALFFRTDDRGLAVLDDVRNADGLSTGQQQEYFVEVTSSSQRLNITLVWTDPAASASTGTGFAAVNDLDLEVVSPGGTTYLGNVFSGGVSIGGGSKDDRNNVEMVQLNNPQVGNWTVRVIAAAVNQGTQGYAAVATGNVVTQLPALIMSIPGGPPTQVLPGVATTFDVQILDGAESLDAGSPRLYYRYDGGSFLSVSMPSSGPDLWEAGLPSAGCSDTPEFYVEAQTTGGTFIRLPADAPAGFFTAAVGTITVTFEDDFETDLGWTVVNGGGLTDGAWDRGVPVGGGDRGDPPTDADGSGRCYLTDNVDGNSDVDSGFTTVTSPTMDASNGLTTISYYRWFSNNSGSGPETDTFVVEISDDGGGSWTTLEVIGPSGEGVSGNWFLKEFDLDGIAGFTPNDQFRIRFTAEDVGTQSVVEAGVDGVQLRAMECSVSCPWDDDGDGDVGVGDLLALLAAWGTDPAGPPDFDGDGDVNVSDLLALLGAWGPCP